MIPDLMIHDRRCLAQPLRPVVRMIHAKLFECRSRRVAAAGLVRLERSP